MSEQPAYRRVLLKISGEALLGSRTHGIDPEVIGRLAGEVATVRDLGVEVCLVVGGGNIFRGIEVASEGGVRVTGDHMGMLATIMNALASDHMGMLATIMNALALRDALEGRGVAAQVFSGLAVPAVCDTFSQRGATAALDDGKVVIFAGGTGNPFFTTDTGAALRAAEMGCDAVFKATQVDGVYSADPKTNPDAERFSRLTHDEMLARGLKVMDAAAVAIARENRIPIVVFSILQPGGFPDIVAGGGLATIVAEA